MDSFWKSIKKIWEKPSKTSVSQPYLHEKLERDESYQNAYQNWKLSSEPKEIIEWIIEQLSSDAPHSSFHIFDNRSTSGLLILSGFEFPEAANFPFFMDYFKENILEMGYKTYSSDARVYLKEKKGKEVIERIERHYLKPRLYIDDAQKQRQLFGNLNIELLIQNDQNLHLKFMASTYQDRNFQTADSFLSFWESFPH